MLKIITHSGTFHADEALAIYMLKKLPKYKEAQIIRTRDPKIIQEGDIVVDVGGIYDPATNRFDHHQREFQETWDNIKLSSAGLVYKHFGKQVIQETVKVAPEHIDLIYQKTYEKLIRVFDAVDNGVNAFPKDVKPLYIDSTTIGSRVARLNPQWNEPYNDTVLYDQFLKAVALTGEEFDHTVKYFGLSWLPARDIVKESVAEAKSVHPSGHIVLLKHYCPWKDHIYELETEFGLNVFYVIYQDGGDQSWRIQAVAEGSGSFISRKPLPSPWRGVRDDLLSEVSGVPGAVFCHASGFIGGNKTRPGALEMAFKALDFKE
ncbi:MYG1/GAMM1-like protein [Gorgonomyces haynaldii]|nr:MYG1/GAMM1-like protein [Gorgonomyces haynaldii]